jgi:hypothetical protein
MCYPNRALTPKGHVLVVHVPCFVGKYGICGVLGEDGSEAAHATDSAARKLVRQMKTLESATRRKHPTTTRTRLARC